MKLLFFFMETFFPNLDHGGSSVILRQIVDALAKRGDEITIICRRRSGNAKSFKWQENVTVLPEIRFKETFPDAYFTPPAYIATAVQRIHTLSKSHDVFINFDSNYILPDTIYHRTPIINCLHDFFYSGALQGAFSFKRGLVIANSEYTRDCVVSTVGRIFPDLSKRVFTITNGINSRIFRRVRPNQIYQYVNRARCDGPILLCPHRPDLDKGVFEALHVTHLIKTRFRVNNVRLLIPIGLDADVSPEAKSFYSRVKQTAQQLALTDNLVLHPWIPHHLMSEYYSLGSVTLCLGTFIESFGNTQFESLLCGTPVVLTKVGAQRSLLPDWCLGKVDPGDMDNAADLVYSILQHPLALNKQRRYIKSTFSCEKMVRKFQGMVDMVLDRSDEFMKPLVCAPTKLTSTSQLALAPWCDIGSRGIYNDYFKKYRSGDFFSTFVNRYGANFTSAFAKQHGLSVQRQQQEIAGGYLAIKSGVDF